VLRFLICEFILSESLCLVSLCRLARDLRCFVFLGCAWSVSHVHFLPARVVELLSLGSMLSKSVELVREPRLLRYLQLLIDYIAHESFLASESRLDNAEHGDLVGPIGPFTQSDCPLLDGHRLRVRLVAVPIVRMRLDQLIHEDLISDGLLPHYHIVLVCLLR
jgi:hypothetical protein